MILCCTTVPNPVDLFNAKNSSTFLKPLESLLHPKEKVTVITTVLMKCTEVLTLALSLAQFDLHVNLL